MSSLPHTIHGTVSHLDSENVTITLDNNTTVTLPRHLLSPSTSEGSSVHLAVFSDEDASREHERLAKAVLTELLRGA